MSLGSDQVTKQAKAAAKKILRRDPNDLDPVKLIECFPGDVIEIPFLGLCELGFFIGHRVVLGKTMRTVKGHELSTPIYGGSASGFVRLHPIERNPPRDVTGVPAWVPVRCIERRRP